MLHHALLPFTSVTSRVMSFYFLQSVKPYSRSNSQSSIRKFSASTGFLASLPPATGPTPSSPIYNINPTLSLPATPIKAVNQDEAKMTDGTSGYLSDSPPSDKGNECANSTSNSDVNSSLWLCSVPITVGFYCCNVILIVIFRKATAVTWSWQWRQQ